MIEFQLKNVEYKEGKDLSSYFTGFRCLECWYKDGIYKILRNELKNNPITTYVQNVSDEATANGWIQRHNCFCNKPADDFHHPDYRRPLEGVWLCAKHHNQFHTLVDRVYKSLSYVPEHLYTRYFFSRDKQSKRVIRPEFEADFLAAKRGLSLRELHNKKFEKAYDKSHPKGSYYCRPPHVQDAIRPSVNHEIAVISINIDASTNNVKESTFEYAASMMRELQLDYEMLKAEGMLTDLLKTNINYTKTKYKSAIESAKKAFKIKGKKKT